MEFDLSGSDEKSSEDTLKFLYYILQVAAIAFLFVRTHVCSSIFFIVITLTTIMHTGTLNTEFS